MPNSLQFRRHQQRCQSWAGQGGIVPAESAVRKMQVWRKLSGNIGQTALDNASLRDSAAIANMTTTVDSSTPVPVTINPLLRHLEPLLKNPTQNISDDLAREIALAVSRIFTNELSPVQSALLLHDLYHTGLEQHPTVLKECARVMTHAAQLPDPVKLRKVIETRGLGHGGYYGGLVW